METTRSPLYFNGLQLRFLHFVGHGEPSYKNLEILELNTTFQINLLINLIFMEHL